MKDLDAYRLRAIDYFHVLPCPECKATSRSPCAGAVPDGQRVHRARLRDMVRARSFLLDVAHDIAPWEPEGSEELRLLEATLDQLACDMGTPGEGTEGSYERWGAGTSPVRDWLHTLACRSCGATADEACDGPRPVGRYDVHEQRFRSLLDARQLLWNQLSWRDEDELNERERLELEYLALVLERIGHHHRLSRQARRTA